MPSERVQRRIDSLLDEAEAAIGNHDWELVRAHCDAVLRLDPDDEDAKTYLAAAEQNTGSGTPGRAAAPHEGRQETPPRIEPRPPGADPPASTTSATQHPMPAAAPDPRPSSFAAGRYRVDRFLGEGAKKRVFLAHDSLLDRDVAFAHIRTEGLDAAGRERITREAQAMGRLGDDANIVPVFDLGQEGDAPYIVSQFMAGGSVQDILSKADGPLPLEQTLKIGIDVCRGLEAAHGANVVHRDLKGGNVWLTDDGTAKLGDFGLAVALDRSRLTQP